MAAAEGARDAMLGVLGMLFGASIYVTFYARLRPVIHVLPDWGEITLPGATGTSPWIWVAGLLIAGTIARKLLERRHRPPEREKDSPQVDQTSAF